MKDPRATYRFEYNRATEKAAAKAKRAQPLPVRWRRITVDGVRYAAFDAHTLLERSAGS